MTELTLAMRAFLSGRQSQAATAIARAAVMMWGRERARVWADGLRQQVEDVK